jgi:hypothetical protein
MLNYRNTHLHQISSPERVLGTAKVLGLSTITAGEAPSPSESPAALSSLNLLQLPTNLSLLNLIISLSKPILSLSTTPPRPPSLSASPLTIPQSLPCLPSSTVDVFDGSVRKLQVVLFDCFGTSQEGVDESDTGLLRVNQNYWPG